MGTNRHMHGRIHAKRGAALLIALLMLMMTVPLSLTAFAAEEGGFEYELINNDSEVKITGYKGESTNVTIPSTLGGKPVTEIGIEAFSGCESITSVTIPDSVTTIGSRAFMECTSLTNVTIPDSVKSIGNRVFSYCELLDTISLGKNISRIGEAVFNDTAYYNDEKNWENGVLYIDSYLISGEKVKGDYKIKEGTTVIASGAFSGWESLTNLTIPDGVITIGNEAFSGCTSLTNVTIPDSVTWIGIFAFAGCTSLADITIGSGVKELCATFVACTSLKEIVIPEGVTTLTDSYGEDYFYPLFADSLQRITIPDSVTKIDVLFDNRPTIVCSKDSYAHKFAVENNYPYEFKTASAPGGINVTTNEGVHFKADESVFPAGTTFQSEKVTSGAKYEVAEKAKNIQKFVAYDITASSNNAAVQPNGTVNVTFAVPEDFDLSKTVIYYISDDGKLELVKSSVDTKARTITAALTHFSTYAVAETATVNGTSGTGSPQTGDSNMVVLWTAIMLFSAAALVFITVKHRKSVKD